MKALVVGITVAAVLAAPAHAAERGVTMPGQFFKPRHVTALVGDTVTWTNHDTSLHNATAEDGSFKTPDLATGQSASVTFASQGTFPYVCTIHRFMTGSIAVFAIALSPPPRAVRQGQTAVLRGLAPPGTAVVDLQRRTSTGGYETLSSTVAAADGTFSFAVSPSRPERYRAVSGSLSSPTVKVGVRPLVTISVRRRGEGRFAVRATASPAQRGAPAALQRYIRERFTFVTIARSRFDRYSRVTFRLRIRDASEWYYVGASVRVKLVRGVNGFAPATSRAIGIRP